MEIKALATSMLGYGTPKDSLERGVAKNPDFIGSDMGSTDPGPHYLGSGEIGVGLIPLKRDLGLVIGQGLKKGIPVLMGSAGMAGTDLHLEKVIQIITELSKEKKWHFKMAVIHSEIDKSYLKRKLDEGKIKPLYKEELAHYKSILSPSDIDNSEHIVAQMGPEPFIKALKEGAQIIVAGRSCDTSIYAALPLMKGCDRGLTMHMAKVIECASQCSRPPSRDTLMGYLREDCVLFEPQNPDLKCTAESVAEHSLYERINPYQQGEPGGMLDLSEVSYEQYDERIAKVSGSKWIPAPIYTVKLEGACKVGYRTIVMGGARDPIMIEQINNTLESVSTIVKNLLSDDYIYGKDYSLRFRVYGKNGVMGRIEVSEQITSCELFILIDVVAKSQELSKSVCEIAMQNLLHYPYEGRVSTGGNLAFPFSPAVRNFGATYKFNIFHLLELEDPCEIFSIDIVNI